MKRGLEKFNFNLKKEINNKDLYDNKILNVFLILAFFSFILMLFMLPFASATFSLGIPNYSIEKIYGPSANIKGWLNISFSSEPLSSLFSDSRGTGINLSEMLKKNIYPYSCSPIGCADDYAASNASPTKTVTLDSGESKIYGIKLTGNIESISFVKFNLTSGAASSCLNQVEIDFLDDGSADFRNTNILESGSCSGSKDRGCFNESQALEDVPFDSLGDTACQRMNLTDSPGYLIGAWIKKTGASGTLKATIHKKTGTSSSEEVASCDLPDPTNPDGEEVSCSVSYSALGSQEHYVCIYMASSTGNYMTKGYSIPSAPRCGFYGIPVKADTSAFWIFSQGKQFDSVGTIDMNKSLSSGKSFAELTSDYLVSKYGSSLDCTSGCVLPIRVKSNVNDQEINLNNLVADYVKEFPATERKFSDVDKTAARVTSTSGAKKLYLDGLNFTVPNNIGDYSFVLGLGGVEILNEKLQVKDIPIIKSLSPIKTASAFPTEFIVSVNSKYNLTSFAWDFGDNTARVTTTGNAGNKVTHSYNQTGQYNLTLNVTDQRGFTASGKFLINVSSPADLIGIRLTELKNSIANLKEDISSLDQFSKTIVNRTIGLGAMESNVSNLEKRYQSANTQVQYNGIVSDLLKIRIPDTISKTRSVAGLPFLSGPDYVDLDVLADVAGGNFSSKDEQGYVNGALFWQVENLETKVDFNEFSGKYDDNLEPIIRIFKITITEKNDIPYDYFFIMPQISGFSSDVSAKNKSGYTYVNMKDQIGKTFSFSTIENIDSTNLPAFISPAISRLTIEETLPEKKPINKWLIFGLVILALLVLGTIAYVILQEWYKRKYENYLFPNRNDLYNMVNYLHNAERKGLAHRDIEDKLKKAGWTGERIRYVMRRYAGKRTGMLELPITKIIKKVEGGKQ